MSGIEFADRQIDALVYELYGLTEEGDQDCGSQLVVWKTLLPRTF